MQNHFVAVDGFAPWYARLDTKVRRPKAVEFGPTFHRVNPVLMAAGCADPEG